jgi:uncharacterized DUF497 family protein
VIWNNPLDIESQSMEYQVEGGEERYKSLGATDKGRALIAVWTLRAGRIRAVTAYPAPSPYKKMLKEMRRR